MSSRKSSDSFFLLTLKVSIDTIEEQANQSMKFIFQKHHQKNGMGFFETAEKEIRFAI
jgi:hypothetical protein